jgi:hypothetical protein
MSRTQEYSVRLLTKEGGVERLVAEQVLGATASTREFRQVIQLSTNTVNYQVNFGSNFTTPTKLMLVEHAGRTFTFSVGANNRHHRVAANGCAFEHGSIASLFLSNNSTNSTKPEIEIILVR